MQLSISVIVPTYNRATALEQCLQSLAVQDYPRDHYEIIVVDDGSMDSTSELMGSIGLPVELRFIRQVNQGSGTARNVGALHATGDILLFVDDDVIATPNLLSIHAEMHYEHAPSAVIGYTPFALDLPRTSIYEFHRKRWNRIFAEIELAASLERIPYYYFITLNLSMRRQDLQRIGPFDTTLSVGFEDTELGLRFSQTGVPLRFCKDALAWHRPCLNEHSLTDRQEQIGYRAGRYYLAHPGNTAMNERMLVAYVLGHAEARRPLSARLRAKLRHSLLNDQTAKVLLFCATRSARWLPAGLRNYLFALVERHYYSKGFRRALWEAARRDAESITLDK